MCIKQGSGVVNLPAVCQKLNSGEGKKKIKQINRDSESKINNAASSPQGSRVEHVKKERKKASFASS